MTEYDPLSSVIARMARHYPPGTVPFMVAGTKPAEVTRKPTDSKPPTGIPEDYGTRVNTNASARSLKGARPPYASSYRPSVRALAGRDPATTRPSSDGRVKPTGGRKIGGPATVLYKGKRIPSEKLLQAYANSEFAGYRQEVSAQSSFAVSTGELPVPGIAVGVKPHERTETLAERETRLAESRTLAAIAALYSAVTG